MKRIDIAGLRFGKLVIERYVSNCRWLAKCDCGKTKLATGDHLRSGSVISCGCAIGWGVPGTRTNEPASDLFWEKVDKRGNDECWPWMGATSGRGYGRFSNKAIPENGSHRIAWMMSFGQIPAGLFVCHRCDNPSCCNPSHLFLGTAKENTQDMVKKGRARGGTPFHRQKNPNRATWRTDP